MSVDVAISRFRQLATDVCRDEATVTRPGVGGGLAADNVWVPAASTPVYSGRCLLRGFDWEGTTTISADQEVRLRRLRAKFPVNTDLRRDDVVVPLESTYDDSLIGVPFRVTDLIRDGWQIARTVILEEIVE